MSFWANKLNGIPTVQTPPDRNMFHTRDMYSNIPTITDPPYTPSVRVTQGDVCPGCGSNSYMGMLKGQGNATVTCFECGYNPRFEQTGYGTPSLRTQPGTVATPAKQTNDHSTIAQGLADIANGRGIHA